MTNLDEKQDQVAQETVDMPLILTYVKYFMEHIKDLLLAYCNPVTKAQYFGVLFDEVASYSEIKTGTANISQIPGLNELFKIAHSEKASLVRMKGLEPSCLAAPAPKTGVSTISPHPHDFCVGLSRFHARNRG